MRSISRRLRPSILVAGLMAVAACADHNPAGAPDGPAPLPSTALAAVTCTASVADGTVACGGENGVSVPGVNAAVIGGQDVYVRLASSGASYDGVDTFRVNVTVENLTPQALGTTDGMTPSPSGVRIFFASGPETTEGTGTVQVANETGTAFFSAAGQPYFQYDGILAPGETSAAREWQFTLPNTVDRFAFVVYVAAPVRAEGGWVGVLPVGPSVAVGDTTPLAATVRNLAGGAVPGASVTWTSSDTSIARVDAQGIVTGVKTGAATITATSGGRTGSVKVEVHPAGYNLATLDRFEILDPSVHATGADSLRFRGAYSGPAGLGLYMEVVIRHPQGGTATCSINNPTRVPAGPMEWRCNLLFGVGVRDGMWRVESVTMSNRRVTHAELLAAGAPAHVQVHSATVDVQAPTLDSLGLGQDTLADFRTLSMTLVVRDNVAPGWPQVFVSKPGTPVMRLSLNPVTLQQRSGGAVVFQLSREVPHYFHGGTYQVDSVRLRDFNENRHTYTRAALDSLGYRTTVEVVSPHADTIPPEFTHFSFAPDTVMAGVDTLRVRVYAFETVDESGMALVEAVFEKADDTTRTRTCQQQTTSALVTDLGAECGWVFAAADAGTWRVRRLRAMDRLGQVQVHLREEIAAASIPTEFVVKAP